MKKFLFIIVFLILFSVFNSVLCKENDRITYTLASVVNYKDYDDIYDFILDIPKINSKTGIYDRNNYGSIILDKESDYPDTNNSNVIIDCDFDYLYKLNTDSLINLYYKHSKYTYKIDTIYNTVNDKIKIIRNLSKKSITLINKNNEIYIGYLIDEIRY